MNGLDLRLELEECRAVRSADVTVSDITVLCGPNASGKTTLSTCFADIIGVSSNYAYWARLLNWYPVGKEVDAFLAADRHEGEGLRGLYDASGGEFRMAEPDFRDEGRFSRKIGAIVEKVREVGGRDFSRDDAAGRAFLACLRGAGIRDETMRPGMMAERIVRKIEACRRAIGRDLAKRDPEIYDFVLGSPQGFLGRSRSFRFYEGRTRVFDSSRRGGGAPADPPWLRGHEGAGPVPLESVSNVLFLNNLGSHAPGVLAGDVEGPGIPPPGLSGETAGVNAALLGLLGGDVGLQKTGGGEAEWVYRAASGGVVERLEQCASGMKNLAALLVALRRGALTASTLLILDEPETHLHPSLIVDYASLLISLCKRLHVRILITTHSPTFVNALWIISRAEGVSETVRFYIAEREGEAGQYVYRLLGDQIGPIFKDFNDAHRKMAEFEGRAPDGGKGGRP